MELNNFIHKGIDDALRGGVEIRTHDFAENQATSWPIPKPLPPRSPVAPSLPPELIPEPLRPWITDSAERLGVPLEYIAVPVLSVLAVTLGRRVGITPKQLDNGWIVVCSVLWSAVIGSPGKKKTPAISAAMKPLTHIEKKYRDQFRKDTAATQHEMSMLSAKMKGIQKKIESFAGKNDTRDLESQHKELAEHLAEITPVWRRLTVQDSTMEKLGEFLSNDSYGMGVMLDELTSWIKGLDRPGHEAARAFYLKAWNGYLADVVDRIIRGTIYIEALYVVVMGGIQPDVFEAYLEEARKGGFSADGLIQRFQLAVFPDVSKSFPVVDRVMDTGAYERALEIFERIERMTPVEIGAEIIVHPLIPCIKFDKVAQQLFNDFLDGLEQELAQPSDSTYESHISKFRSTMPALALLFHLVDLAHKGLVGNELGAITASYPVTLESARRAAMWIDYLKQHARTIYGYVNARELDAAHALAAKILSGDIRTGDSVRSIYRKGWASLGKSCLVYAAIEVLEDLGWIQLVQTQTGKQGGRFASKIIICPNLNLSKSIEVKNV